MGLKKFLSKLFSKKEVENSDIDEKVKVELINKINREFDEKNGIKKSDSNSSINAEEIIEEFKDE